MSRFKKELEFAVELVRKAIKITEWFSKKGFESFLKLDQSPVTLADFASQIYIISQLKEYFPDDEIIAEEENINFVDLKAENLINLCFTELGLEKLKNVKENVGFRGVSSNREWTVDPIDGTMGYLKNLTYAVGIGFMLKSIPKTCAIAIPNYKEHSSAVFSAECNQGTQVSYDNEDFTHIKVSQNEDIQKIRLSHSLHYDKPWVLKFARKIGIKDFIQVDSMAKFCMVADGSADLYIKPLDRLHSFTWDFMPGDLIVREAGGEVTDLKGERLRFKKEKCIWTAPGIIASNSILQKKIKNLYKTMEL